MKQGICTNFGNCTKADDPDRLKHPLQIPDGADLVCPQCGAPLTLTSKGPSAVRLPVLLLFALLGVGAIGAGAWHALKPKPASMTAPVPAPPLSPPALRPVSPPPASTTPAI